MTEGENTVTKKDFVTVEFDPFKEQTITTNNVDGCFNAGSTYVEVSLKHWKSPDQDLFQIVFDITDGTSYDDVEFTDLIITADQEVIKPMGPAYSEMGKMVDNNDGTAGYHFDSYGHICFTPEAIKKIASASNIECRYYSKEGYTDLDTVVEEWLQTDLAIMYNESVDSNAFSDIVQKRKKALEQQQVQSAVASEKFEKETKRNKIIKWCLIVMIVMFVYFLLDSVIYT